MLLSEKQKDFMRCPAKVEFMEGTSFSGKTNVASKKFVLKCQKSQYTEHVLAASTQQKVESNILGNPDDMTSILWLFKEVLEYFPRGAGRITTPHLKLKCVSPTGEPIDKIIYVVGMNDVSAITKIRGWNRIGCSYVDELNKTNEEAARELCMRSLDWFCGSLNPDSPEKGIYTLVNKARPLAKWRKDVPEAIMRLLTEEKDENYVYWHFNFNDNPICTPEIVAQKKAAFVEGSALYNSLILGIRTKPEGVIFKAFSSKCVMEEFAIRDKMSSGEIKFELFCCGADTSYSTKTEDKNAVTFCGITEDHKIIALEELIYSNRGKNEEQAISPDELCEMIDKFLNRCEEKWGYIDFFYLDAADQATLQTWNKYRIRTGSYYSCFKSEKLKYKIEDRIRYVDGWLKNGYMFVCENCENLIMELYNYSYDDKTGKPIERFNHSIDSFNYAWTQRYCRYIGEQI